MAEIIRNVKNIHQSGLFTGPMTQQQETVDNKNPLCHYQDKRNRSRFTVISSQLKKTEKC